MFHVNIGGCSLAVYPGLFPACVPCLGDACRALRRVKGEYGWLGCGDFLSRWKGVFFLLDIDLGGYVRVLWDDEWELSLDNLSYWKLSFYLV